MARDTGTYVITTTLSESGELRRSQNWIGGTRPGNAAFVPPPPEHVPVLLANMEHFIRDDEATMLPPMVKIALIHEIWAS